MPKGKFKRKPKWRRRVLTPAEREELRKRYALEYDMRKREALPYT